MKKTVAAFLVVCSLSSFCFALETEPTEEITSDLSTSTTETPTDDSQFESYYYDKEVEMINGITPAFIPEKNQGAHYYAFSPMSSTYFEAYANIRLPTANEIQLGQRNAYISLGIKGEKGGVDLGLIYFSDSTHSKGWYPVHNDVYGETLINQGQSFPFDTSKVYDQKLPSGTTNVVITVNPEDTSHVRMYLSYRNGSDSEIGKFEKVIRVVDNNFTYGNNGKVSCSFYRFASLVPKQNTTDNRMDSTYMINGKFSALALYNRNSKSYEDWGIDSNLVNSAWKVYPERISFSSTYNSETFSIDHWYGK